jgi:hypothetical protein
MVPSTRAHKTNSAQTDRTDKNFLPIAKVVKAVTVMKKPIDGR